MHLAGTDHAGGVANKLSTRLLKKQSDTDLLEEAV